MKTNEAPRCKQRGILWNSAEANPPSPPVADSAWFTLAIHPRGEPRGILAKANKFLSSLVSVIGFVVIAAWAADSSKMMSVQVKTTPLRDTPSFVSKAGATLSYGDRVEVLDTQGAWSKVNAPGGLSGWVHTSALSSKRIVLQSGRETAQSKASSDELALAGKGFNSDVEGEFKKQHRNIDFSWIDKMEKMRISSGEMQAFLKEGGVTPKEGGAQ